MESRLIQTPRDERTNPSWKLHTAHTLEMQGTFRDQKVDRRPSLCSHILYFRRYPFLYNLIILRLPGFFFSGGYLNQVVLDIP